MQVNLVLHLVFFCLILLSYTAISAVNNNTGKLTAIALVYSHNELRRKPSHFILNVNHKQLSSAK